MKWMETLKVGEHITAHHSINGTWYLSHPGKTGKSTTYSTGVKGTQKQIKQWIKENKVQDLVEVGMRTQLTRAVINRLTDRNITWPEVYEKFVALMTTRGRAINTIERTLGYLTAFLTDMKLLNKPPHEVTEQHVYDWINFKVHTKLTTKVAKLQALKSSWNFLVDRGYVEKNIPAQVGIRRDILSHEDKEKKPVLAFTPNEIERLTDAIQEEIYTLYERCNKSVVYAPRARPRKRYSKQLEGKLSRMRFFYSAVNLAYGIGLRRSDCALLEWASIHTLPGWLVIHTEKTKARVAIPYEGSAIKLFLEEVPVENRATIEAGLLESAPYIKRGILSINQGEHIDFDLCFPEWAQVYIDSPGVISVYFKRLLDTHGFKGKSFHSLRHGRIRAWKKAGLTLDQIGRFVGHSNTRTTEGYL